MDGTGYGLKTMVTLLFRLAVFGAICAALLGLGAVGATVWFFLSRLVLA